MTQPAQNTIYTVDLDSLRRGLPGVTKALGEVHAEACMVCFDDQKHASGVELQLEGSLGGNVLKISWAFGVTDQMRRAHNDEQVATEYAAYGIAFLVVLNFTQYTIIEKSRKGTGFDYWAGSEPEGDWLPFERAARLEVSGIRRAGSDGEVSRRVRTKVAQTSPTDNQGLPAYIVVVEFGKPLSHVVVK